MTPFASQVLMKASLEKAVTVYLIVGLVCSLSSLLLPVETAGRDLDEPHQATGGGYKKQGYQQQKWTFELDKNAAAVIFEDAMEDSFWCNFRNNQIVWAAILP